MDFARLIILSTVLLCSAFSPDETMSNPDHERRAQNLYREVRCVVCDGQDVAHSNAELASDMRAWIRNNIERGKSDTEILALIEDRYGPSILMTPKADGATLSLWLFPWLCVILGLGAIMVYFKQIRKVDQD